VLPIGTADAGALDAIERGVGARFPFPVRRLPPLDAPAFAWDPGRGQYDSSAILTRVAGARRPDAARVLGVTEADLFIPMLTFVFGQAQLRGAPALISLARLRQEFHGLPPSPGLLAERAVKEAFHELGHTFGLVHCTDPSCIASLATNLQRLDAKRGDFCRDCSALLAESLASIAGAPSNPHPSEERS
jgi:archaemetzincin